MLFSAHYRCSLTSGVLETDDCQRRPAVASDACCVCSKHDCRLPDQPRRFEVDVGGANNVRRKKVFECVGAQRPGEQEALQLMTTLRLQKLGLAGGFNAF